MRSRAWRTVVLVLLLAGGAGASWSSWRTSQEIAGLDRRQRELNERIDRLLSTIDAVTGAQQAHVTPSPGQDPLTVPALIDELRMQAEELRPHLRSLEAGRTLEALASAAALLQDIETRAEDHLRLGQDLMATDLIFTEGRAVDVAVASSVRALRAAEDESFGVARAGALDSAWTIVGLTAAFWVAGLMLLTRLPAASAPPSTPVSVAGASLLDEQSLHLEPPAVVRPNLQAAADVCTALGRLTSADDLPRLLQQAAAVLDASGVVVWMAAGEELFAAAAFGYAPAVVRTMGPINRAAINATAAAWRSGALQAVAGDDSVRSALAAPMLGAERCIGVLAVEMKAGREEDPAIRAVATLIAAQLAAAVAAWPAASTAAPIAAPPLERAAEA